VGSAMSEARRLLLVTNRLATGGAESMLITLAQSLNRERLVPVVACLKEPGPLAAGLEARGVSVHAHLLRHKADVLAIGRMASLIRRERIDAVCAVGSGGDRMFWSILAARDTGCASVVWSHIHPSPGHHGFERPNRVLYRWVDRFVALGRRHRLALIRDEHLPAGRVVVIRNGIEVEPFDRSDLREEARRRLGLSGPGQVAVGIVANLRPDKRHDVFIEAGRRIAARYPQAIFYIIGSGPAEPAVRGCAATSGLDSRRLRLLGERHDVATLMQGLDIVCLCSEWQECLSVVMLEAMAAGRAFIGPKMGSLDEALIDGRTGRVTRPADPESLAAVLAELIADPDRRDALGRAAREKVMAEFRARHMATAFEDLAEALCGRRAAGRKPCCLS
jgi:glycosyltransferase involved in cell wall biosynthesis